MATVIIDGKEYEMNPANNLLQECLSRGIDLPYFCWHPCMGSVGACRQCTVRQYRNEDDREGILVMACMTPASEGTRIAVQDSQARDMRQRVIESLMINHPHDCPVCEEGGECHLQDMTLMSGHNYRRYDKRKRTHRNQYLGPFINHEMNRCIACYRCVRFYQDYAGGTDLAAQAAHHHVYFGRHEEGVLESEFSGNLVEVCPTGVFTDRVFSGHYTRKWDLQTAPSVCVGCAVGCNTTPGERYGSLRRITNRYNSEVNGYFLCDRGRFGFDYVNSDERLGTPVVRAGGRTTPLSRDQVADLLAECKAGEAIGIGSPRASNEANYALRLLVGEADFHAGIADDEHAVNRLLLRLLRDTAFHSPSVREMEQADAVLIVGEDVTNTAPRIALALRQSVRNRSVQMATASKIPLWQDAAVRSLAQGERSPLSILCAHATRLDDVASEVIVDGYAGQAALANAVAAALSPHAPAGPAGLAADQQATAAAIAGQLAAARRPLVICGSGHGQVELVKAAANVARALQEKNGVPTALCLVPPEVNSLGLELLVPSENSLGAALEKLAAGTVSKAIVLENDLYRRAPHRDLDQALDGLEQLVVLDLLPTPTTARATHVLPVTAFSEHEASYVNYEGRAQLSYQVHACATGALPAWQWLYGNDIDALITRCSTEVADFRGLDKVLPRTDRVVAGMKIPRQLHRYSGRTAMGANLDVHEPKQPQDNQSVMAFSMEGVPLASDPPVLGSAWAPGWNSNQSISKFQDEVNGELKQGHPGTLLIERTESGQYADPETGQSSPPEGQLEVAWSWQIFGSDELSARSTAIRERSTGCYISLSPADAKSRGIRQGDAVRLDGNGTVATACIRTSIQPGTAALYNDGSLDRYALPSHLALEGSDQSPDRGIDNLLVSDRYEESN